VAVRRRDLARHDDLQPANSESQMNVVPRKVGFSRHSTRRSASFLLMRSQARISCGRTVE
jgi:hypothetical protein